MLTEYKYRIYPNKSKKNKFRKLLDVADLFIIELLHIKKISMKRIKNL